VKADVLSDVLGAIHLTGAVFFDYSLSGPWAVEAPPAREIAATVMPGAQRVIEYHLIAGGTCWGCQVGRNPIRLREGDLILFPQGDAHVLSSAPGMRAAPDLSAYARPPGPRLQVCEVGGGGPDRAHIVCAFLGCDERPFNPLLTALPSFIHLPAAGPQATTGWLAILLSRAARESGSERPGSENVLARLSELMFVEAIPAARREGLARGAPGSGGRTGAGRAARRRRRLLDGRSACPGSGRVSVGARRAVYGHGRAATDAVPDLVAHAARVTPAARRRPGGRRCRRRRLRVGGGIQPGLQEAAGPVPRNVAEEPGRDTRLKVRFSLQPSRFELRTRPPPRPPGREPR